VSLFRSAPWELVRHACCTAYTSAIKAEQAANQGCSRQPLCQADFESQDQTAARRGQAGNGKEAAYLCAAEQGIHGRIRAEADGLCARRDLGLVLGAPLSHVPHAQHVIPGRAQRKEAAGVHA
jgi:hypothetical protein